MVDSGTAGTLLILGLLVLFGWASHALGERTHVPRVTLLLLVGVLIGPSALHLAPDDVGGWFPLIAHISLAMVGFLLGEHLVASVVNGAGRLVMAVAVGVALATAFLVSATLMLLGSPPALALLLGGISTATDPAASMDVVREGRAEGPLTKTLLSVVAVDDGVGVLLFSVLLVAAQATLALDGTTDASALWGAGREIGLSVVIGAGLGLPMAWATGRLRKGEPALPEALGFVLVCGGLSSMFDASYLISCMSMGAVVAATARHHTRPFHAIENVSEPFLASFFVLAGMELDLASLPQIGVVGVAYCLARVAGRIVGGRLGAVVGGATEPVRSRIGLTLLPQAGVALGLALVGAERCPEVRTELLALVVATTVVFELVGPLVTRWQLGAAGEMGAARAEA